MNTWVEREARRIQKAIALLGPALPGPAPPGPGIPMPGGIWADLGCGDGIFTLALYSLIGPDGEIYAVDRDRYALDALLRHFAESYPDAIIHPLQADFTRPPTLPPLDGIVMANSLHFTQAKAVVLRQLASLLKPGGRLIVVEYNTSRGNSAVPYPLDEHGFLKLAGEAGLRDARIITRIPSSFIGEMYAGLAWAIQKA